MKEIRHKRSNIVWLYLCEISRIGKSTETENTGCQGLGEQPL